jgi:hypothetical protein
MATPRLAQEALFKIGNQRRVADPQSAGWKPVPRSLGRRSTPSNALRELLFRAPFVNTSRDSRKGAIMNRHPSVVCLLMLLAIPFQALAQGKWTKFPAQQYSLADVEDVPELIDPDLVIPSALPALRLSVQVQPGRDISPELRAILPKNAPPRTGNIGAQFLLPPDLPPGLGNVLRVAEDAEEVTQVEIARPKGFHPINHPPLHPTRNRPFNQDARLSHSVNLFEGSFHEGGGSTINAAIFDGGKVWSTHEEFKTDRVEILDDWAKFSAHATHVAGTMAARGNPKEKARGMAPLLHLRSFYFGRKKDLDEDSTDADADDDDLDRLAANASDFQVSNHSYGPRCGWDFEETEDGQILWIWWGGINGKEDAKFGKYSGDNARHDRILCDNPHLLSVVAAGNDRNDEPPFQPITHWVPVVDPDTNELDWVQSTKKREVDGFDRGGLDTVAGLGVSKNSLCVGAIDDLFEEGEPVAGAQIETTDFSGWGPTDDFRIKPDVVANGRSLLSTTTPPPGALNQNRAYMRSSGTSMASPTASGICAVLAEFCEAKRHRPSSAELKALVIHSATDAGEPGPDPRFGWGSINAFRAGETIDSEDAILDSFRVADGETRVIEAHSTGQPIRVTVVWLDPPGDANIDGLDDDAKTLKNDLDLVLIDPNGNPFHPYRLDTSDPFKKAKTDGPNQVDNVEVIDAAAQNGVWTIRVTATSLADEEEQEFALVTTGLKRQ